MDILKEENIINGIVILVILVLCTYFDIRKKEIPVYPIVFTIFMGVFLVISNHKNEWQLYLGGALIGGFFMILAKITRESIGIGDGILLIATGINLGIYANILLIMTGFMLAFVWAIILLCFKNAKRKTMIPFVPFLLISYIIIFTYGGIT